jgi:hypothetical protein
MGKPTKPVRSELDDSLRRFINKCWHEQLRTSGKPVCQRKGNLVWLASMPCGTYHVESGVGGVASCSALCQ